MDSLKDSDKKDLDDVISLLSPADFDGHTSMLEMTPEQRLMWLSQAALFVYETRKRKESLEE